MLDWICTIGMLLVSVPYLVVSIIVFNISCIVVVLLGRIGIITTETALHLLEHMYYVYSMIVSKPFGTELKDTDFVTTISTCFVDAK